MASFISVQLKKTSEVDLAKPLVKFIQQTYPNGGEEQAQYCRAAEELSKLRRAALGRPLDKHEGALETLLRYYDQICSIEPKFPFSENQICLTFTWKDAFDKGSLFGGSVKLGIGAFLHIKETVLSALNREPTVDISPDTVGTLSLIMLAQAQEVFFLKATRDKMKDAIIAKLANQAADYFGDAFKQCQYKDTLPKEVFPILAAKHCIMQANAEYHQSILAKQQKKFGEEIARLQHAAELIKTVASRYDEYVNVKEFSDKISRALTAAKKDNDFIYHDRVPDLKDLDPIGKATLVKSTPVNVPISQKFTDLFEKMVPVSVQQALAAYNQRKADLVNRSIAQMREATTLANGVLASLNLPAAIEDVSGDTVPQSILTKSTSVIEQGGIQTVDQLIKELPELLQRNREILDESLRLLDEEEATDSDLRAKFKERWQRTPSNELYKPLRAEGNNFRAVLDKAVQADGQVKERYQSHRDTIALLCKPEPELNAAIPSANPAKTMQGSEVRRCILMWVFYNELTEILVRFQNKCSDIVFARKTERDELLKDLQQSIAREPSAPSIPTPAYQSSPAAGHAPTPPTPAPRTMPPTKPQPPARPPPPVLPANRAPSATAPAPVATGTTTPAPSQTPGSAPPPQAQGPPYPTYPGYPGYCQMPMPMGYNPYAYGQYNMPYPPVYHQSPGQAPYPGPQQPSYPFPQPPQQSYYPQQ
uniref:BRO1 domain-containing protein n=1 Tax=Equus asinus asinus TaxID=83772 RepID=A0A8C4LF53_EQUAS